MANKMQKMYCISLDKNSTIMSTPTEILFSALTHTQATKPCLRFLIYVSNP